MIYLIGGVSKTGKSFISRKLMESKNIPFFSTDFLLWSLGGEDGLFSYYDDDNKVAPILEDYLMKILYFLNRNNQTYIIEGTHVTISLIKKAISKYGENIRAVLLGYTNVTPLEKYEEIKKYESDETNKWYTLLSEEDFLAFLKRQQEKSVYLKKEAKKENILFFDVTDKRKEYDTIINSLIGM